MTSRLVWTLIILILAGKVGLSQEAQEKRLSSRVFGLFQTWALYEHGQEVWDPEAESYRDLDDRVNLSLRRSRAGLDLFYGDFLFFRTVLELDQVGPPILGDPDKVKGPDVGLLESFMTWRLGRSEAWNLTAGFFRPQISRENITSAWTVNSMEKSSTQTVIRNFLTGNPFGRAPGVNLGGMGGLSDLVHYRFDVGFFTPGHGHVATDPVRSEWQSRWLLSARLAAELGDPEHAHYGLGHKINYFGKRTGVSLAAQAALLAGDAGNRYALGADILANNGHWQLDGEIFLLSGHGEEKAVNTTGHVRFGKNFGIGEEGYIQPFVLWGFFRGPMDSEMQREAILQGMSSGSFSVIGAGAMYYFLPDRIAVTLQYTLHTGDAGQAGPGSTVNAYFSESGLGSIHRGNWLGIGIQLTLI